MIEKLLASLGVSPQLLALITDWGATGSILVAITILLARFVLIPLFTKSIGVAIERYFTRGDEIIDKLDKFLDNQDKMMVCSTNLQAKQDAIQARLDELIDESVGNTDMKLALSTFSTFMNSIHLRLYVFFWRRVRANHIMDNSDLIWGRYESKLDELKSKTITQLGKYCYKGRPLSLFWSNGGADSFFRHLGNELYNIQYLRADGDKFCSSLTEEDLENAFDRLLSKEMGAFKRWLDDDKTYADLRGDYNFHLFKNEQISQEIEEL